MTRCLSHLASTGLVAGAMATLPVGLGIGQSIKSPGFLTPAVQVRGTAGRLRSAMVAANDAWPALAIVAQRAAAAAESDKQDAAENDPDEAKPVEGSGKEEPAGGFGDVEQIGPDLTRDEEEAAIEGGWGD